MADVIADNTEGYDKIANLIASRIDKNFQDLLKELVEGGDPSSFTSDGVSITTSDLENFLTVLGGSDLAIKFTPRLVKGTISKFTAATATSPAALLGGSVEVSIGGRWSF